MNIYISDYSKNKHITTIPLNGYDITYNPEMFV